MSLKPIRGADHVGLTVPDLDAAVSFFVEVLGATEQFRIARKNDAELMEHGIGVHRKASFRAAMLRLTPTLSVELFQWQAPAQNPRMPEPSDSGGHHLCVIVDDLDSAVDELRRWPDLRVYGGPGRLTVGPHAGGRWIYFRTSWGLQIELIAGPTARGVEGRTEEHRDVQ